MTSRPGLPPLTPLALHRWAVVEPIIDDLAPSRVLEIGCGVGGFAARLAARSTYLGIETDEVSRERARAGVEPFGGQVVGDPVEGLGAGVFDVVCAFEVLEHIEDDRAALASWVDQLRVGGTLLISVPAHPDRFTSSDEAVGHYRRYGADQVVDALQAAGLVDVTHRFYGWPLGYLTEGVRARIAARRRPASLPATMSARTATSGRLFQPGALTGTLVRAGTYPFIALQNLRPDVGVGLVVAGRRPGAGERTRTSTPLGTRT